LASCPPFIANENRISWLEGRTKRNESKHYLIKFNLPTILRKYAGGKSGFSQLTRQRKIFLPQVVAELSQLILSQLVREIAMIITTQATV